MAPGGPQRHDILFHPLKSCHFRTSRSAVRKWKLISMKKGEIVRLNEINRDIPRKSPEIRQKWPKIGSAYGNTPCYNGTVSRGNTPATGSPQRGRRNRKSRRAGQQPRREAQGPHGSPEYRERRTLKIERPTLEAMRKPRPLTPGKVK